MPPSVVIIRHALEANRVSNSGRIAAAALPDAQLLAYGEREETLDLGSLARPNTWLLYPEGEVAERAPASVERLVVLDATWPQARRMRQRIGALRGLPVLRVPPPIRSFARLRKTDVDDRLPTAIAIATALELLGARDAAQRLWSEWEQLVEACRVDGRL